MVQSVITTRFLEKHLVIPWRIHEFLAGGGGASPIISANSSMETPWKLNKLNGEGRRFLVSPWSAWIR